MRNTCFSYLDFLSKLSSLIFYQLLLPGKKVGSWKYYNHLLLLSENVGAEMCRMEMVIAEK